MADEVQPPDARERPALHAPASQSWGASDVELRAAPPLLREGMLAFVSLGASASTHSDVDARRYRALLDPEEAALADALAPARQALFVAGRIAMRAAIGAMLPGQVGAPILRTPRGAPQLPDGVSGSISHKRTRAVALAAPSSHGSVGVDLETRPSPAATGAGDRSRALARRILTADEQKAIEGLRDYAHRQATLLHFALKEAVYKAIDPFVERYVRFTEVELDVSGNDGAPIGHGRWSDESHADGSATVRLRLTPYPVEPLIVGASWMMDDAWIVATAVARIE